jgi:glycosyltransferase involved in cell wall biosynthesis
MKNHDVVFFGAENGFFNVDKIPNVKLTRYVNWVGTFFSPALFTHLADFDILHSAETFHGFTVQCAIMKKIFNSKLVVTCWENISYPDPSLKRSFGGSIVKKNSDSFIAVTEKSKDALIVEGFADNKISVIPPGIDLERFKSYNSKLRDNFEEDIIILFVGRLTPEKGVIELLKAMETIWHEEGKITSRLIICGNGELQNLVFQKMKQFPITYYDNFLYDSIPDLYNASDIFVLPSKPIERWEEQFGMVLVEAMACGKPVVSTKSGSIPQVVNPKASLLVNPGDPDDLRNAISELINDNKLRITMGLKSREFVEENYDNKKISKRLEDLYTSI